MYVIRARLLTCISLDRCKAALVYTVRRYPPLSLERSTFVAVERFSPFILAIDFLLVSLSIAWRFQVLDLHRLQIVDGILDQYMLKRNENFLNVTIRSGVCQRSRLFFVFLKISGESVFVVVGLMVVLLDILQYYL